MMLCKSISENELRNYKTDWIAENKLDGTRCLLIKTDNKINLISRNNNDYTNKYPEIVKEALILPDCILDGELTYFNSDGKDIFLTSLANEETRRQYEVKPKLMVFDILELNGTDVKRKLLLERKELLKQTIPELQHIKILEWHIDALDLWQLVKEQDREGIILKYKYSPYTLDCRSKFWIKVKNFKEGVMEFEGYEVNMNNKGLTLTNKEGYRCACLGFQSAQVKKVIDEKGKIKARIQYLEKTINGRYRHISFRGVEV